jgi:riboflavin kinase/FMN adenylyltransferase
VNLAVEIEDLAVGAATGNRPIHLAIGMFDGVHLGHRSVIEAAAASARRTGGVAMALTFDPHPSRVLRPEAAVPLLMPLDAKVQRLRMVGAEEVITQTFTPEFAAVEAEGFVSMLRRALPHLSALYVGENWRFGRARRGDVTMLQALANLEGLSVFSAPRVSLNGEPISSTRIRAALVAGELETANELLGYSYRSEAEVVPGRRLGRTLNFPTLNMRWQPECCPALGVYAVRIGRAGADRLSAMGVANYGVRPTVEQAGEVKPMLEVHVLSDAVAWGEGDRLAVEWCHFIRAEQQFAGLEALRAQIERDVETARTLFKSAE